MDKLPPLSVDLISELDRMYPAITAEDVLRKPQPELHAQAGARAVVEFLLARKVSTVSLLDGLLVTLNDGLWHRADLGAPPQTPRSPRGNRAKPLSRLGSGR